MARSNLSRTAVRTLAAASFVAMLAVPALPVTIANTQWTTTGKSVTVVKGLGKSKSDASALLTFFAEGDVRSEDAFERVFTGSYAVIGRKQKKADLSFSTASTSVLEALIESEVEAAVLRKKGESVDATVDVTTVVTKVHFNKKGTKVKLKMKAKAIGFADLDPRRRKTTYTVSTKGGPSL